MKCNDVIACLEKVAPRCFAEKWDNVGLLVGREDKEPTMSELRESGDIEQDASVIILLWNLDDEGKKKGCKIEKNRQGKIGTVKMEFNGDLMKFVELTDRNGFEPIDDSPFAPI